MSFSTHTVSVTDPNQSVYSVPLEFLQTSHLSLSIGGTEAPLTTFSGTSGAGSATIHASDLPVTSGTSLVFTRVTPNTAATRLVDFTDGATVTEESLDTSALQLLFIAQEATDQLSEAMSLVGGHWDADNRKITNLAAPSSASDAARKSDVDGIALAAGNLPDASLSEDGTVVLVYQGAWEVNGPDLARTRLGLGSAATKDAIGEGGPEDDDDILTVARIAELHLAKASNLIDLPSVSTARTNLGLGTVALLDSGTASGEVPVLGANGLPNVSGEDLDLSGHTVFGRNGGMLDVVARCQITQLQVVSEDAAGITAADWDTKDANELTIESTFTALNNGSSDISITDSAGFADDNEIDLAAGDYKVTVSISFEHYNSGTNTDFTWALIDHTGVSHGFDTETKFRAAGSPSAFHEHLAVTRTALLSLATPGVILVRAAAADASTVRIRDGEIVIQKVND